MPKRSEDRKPKVFTDLVVKAFKCPAGFEQVEYFDQSFPNFLMRVTAKGKKTWGFKYKHPYKGWVRANLGSYGQSGEATVSLADAHEAAKAILRMVAAGKDPQAPPEKPAEVRTFGQVMQDRIDLVISKFKTAKATTDRYYRQFPKTLLDTPIKDIKTINLNSVTDPMVKHGSPYAARRAQDDMVAIMNFAKRRGEVDFNPLEQIEKLPGSNAGDHSLTHPEIAAVWHNTKAAAPRAMHLATILQLMLCTAQRVGEVSGMMRSEIDRKERLWTIPKERTKNGIEHSVPLNDLAWEIVNERLRQTNGDALFPCRNDLNEAIGVISLNNALACIHAEKKLPGVRPFTTHDLRRTVSSEASLKKNNLPVADKWMDHVLNHIGVIKSTVRQRHYNTNTFLDEKRDAMDEWGRFLAKLIGRDDAVAMKIAAE